MIDTETVAGIETHVDRSGERFGDAVTIAHLARYSLRDADGWRTATAYAVASILRHDWRDELESLVSINGSAIVATFRDGSGLRVQTPNPYGKPVDSYWRNMGAGGVPVYERARWDGDKLANRGAPHPLWSGKGAPPHVGDVVPLTGRGGHTATITGYVVESGWLMALAYRTAEPATRGTLAGAEISYPAPAEPA